MAMTYLAPGVYVEEVPSVHQPIAGVGTNTAAFIGVVPDEIQYPVPNEDYDPHAAALIAAEGNGERAKLNQQKKKLESERDQINENELEITANEKKKREIAKQRLSDQIKQLDDQIKDQEKKVRDLKGGASLEPYSLETFSDMAPPFAAKLCTNLSEYRARFGPFSADDKAKPGEALHPGHRALSHAVAGFFMNGGTRCFVLRIKGDDPGKVNIADFRRALQVIESIDAVAIVAAPGIVGREAWEALYAHCEKCSDRFAILDCHRVAGMEDELDVKLLDYGKDAGEQLPPRNKNAAFYFPHIEVADPAKQLQDMDPSRNVSEKSRGRVHVAPSGHMAGIYARVDEQRGVHKAPANEPVRGALGVAYYIGSPRQGLLNPQGVNCIRDMNGNIRVWGARTIGGDKNGEWKYVNVRRLFLFLRESIDEGTQWVVFEPNDQALWGKIRRNVSAFLRNVWRAGALFGSSPEEAFYVKCDAETNPASVRELGQVVTEIGVAIVRPAEFVVFRVTQWTGPEST